MQIGLFGQVAAAFFNFILFFEEMWLNIVKYTTSSITHETKTNLYGFFGRHKNVYLDCTMSHFVNSMEFHLCFTQSITF